MNPLIQHIAIIGLSFVATVAAAREEGPTGCRDSKMTTELLRLLGSRDWDRWTREDLVDAWPGFLHIYECEPKEDECAQFETCHCDRLIAQDRVIGADCECCDLFFFDLVMEGGRVTHERLEIAILHHAASTKETAIADAEVFMRAIGFNPAASGHKKFGDMQSVEGHYEWPSEVRGVENSLELSLREVSAGCTIFLYWTRHEVPVQ